MTLTNTAATYRASLVAQLYDEWGGYYILQRLTDGRYQDVRTLTRAEAETIRLREDESLLIVRNKC